MTMSDQLVVGICLLLMISLYLSVRGKNYSLIQSAKSLREPRSIRIEIIYNLMGNNQVNNQEDNTQQKIPQVLIVLTNLLKSAKLTKISNCTLKLGEDAVHSFTIITHQSIDNPYLIKGHITIQANQRKTIFQGNVVNCIREGFGVQYTQNGAIVYSGQFSNNLYNGWGQTSMYKGQFKNGKKDGWGVFTDSETGLSYQGFFKEGKFNGIGLLNIENDDFNDFISQNQIFNPKGNLIKRYAGNWQNGKMNGRGKLTYGDQIYVGQFKQGLYHGEGKLIQNTHIMEGKFYQGNKI